ncbi:hypothetical protein [Clostridium beijerinckii]|uniref:Uncharacterized protein n=1 Tax=Clostridium beijerinckii TaxID=1520 RepID=A0AAE5EX54_CLOBE|nr:hypothetical protein [Clostridium beijerinckii]NSB12144.1 hypothetical protein [Clostridium beijerinckii]OOM23054.1 hypothetical protein CLOBE_42150 [Clostridium beijerinckii]
MYKVYISSEKDIFSDEGDPIIHYEIYELDFINNYDKRASSPPLEYFYTIYNFSVKSSMVDESTDMFKQLEYLKNKPKEIQEKFEFKSERCGGKSYDFEGIAKTLKMDYLNNREECERILRRNLRNPYI